MDVQALIPDIIQRAVLWVQTQRDRYRATGRPLTGPERTALERFFEPTTLDAARISWVFLLEDPPFYPEIQRMFPQLPTIPFSQMRGITFADTILLAHRGVLKDPPLFDLLFHELVHVVQYEVLGVKAFLDRYVRGYFEQGFSYERIPLESHTYQMQYRFQAAPTVGFSVRAEVEQMRNTY